MKYKTYLPAACLLALLCDGGYAAAMPYSTLIVFGDSLLDAGQFPDSGGPAGSSQRFTNRTGPDYLDNNREAREQTSATLLGRQLGIDAQQLAASTSVLAPTLGQADGNNWATGGATTAQILSSITSTSIIGDGSGVILRQRPGYLPGQQGRADPNALYYLSGGANDFFQGLITSPDSAAAAAERLTASAYALQQAGARYMLVWLLPDLGLTPLNYGTAQQTPASLLGNAFNGALVQQLAQVPAQVIPLNMPMLINEILAAPGSFGFIDGTPLLSTCFSGMGCTANPQYGIGGSTPDPDKLLFNDSVHTTRAGHRIIADYAYSLLAAPWELSLLPQMAETSLNAQEQQLRQSWQADAGAWQSVGTWRAIVSGGAAHQDLDRQASAVAASGRQKQLQVGSNYRLSEDWRTGVLAGAYRNRLKAGEQNSRYNLDSYLASAFVQYQHASWWADASLSAGRLDYRDLQRNFALGSNRRAEQGKTDGTLWGANARLGYELSSAPEHWQLSPFLSAAYSRAQVNGYGERGERATALQVEEQTLRNKRLGAGVRASLQVLPTTRLFAEASHEHAFDADRQSVTMAQKALPTLAYRLDGYRPAQQLNRLNLGLQQQLNAALAVQLGYNLDKRDTLSQQGITLGLTVDF